MAAPRPRLVALDVLRGLAVAGMILATSPGDWATTYAPLKHADWNGWTTTDMVFPTFLFAVGLAVGLSFPRATDAAAASLFWRRLGRRVVLLILLGLALEATYNLEIALGAPFPGAAGLGHLRLPGILQRIALCYLAGGAFLFLTARGRTGGAAADLRPGVILGAVLVLLAGYWALITQVPVPGFGAGHLDPVGSLPAFIDRAVFTVPHLWIFGAAPGAQPTYDPEGLLSTLPAITNLLWGALAAWVVRHRPGRAPLLIGAAGLVLIALGLALDPLLPINKRLWTSTFALLSSGVSAAVFALLLLIPARLFETLLMPLRVLGGNAILAFILGTLIDRLVTFPILPSETWTDDFQTLVDHRVLALVGSPYLASLLVALLTLALVVALLWPLHRRAIHFRL